MSVDSLRWRKGVCWLGGVHHFGLMRVGVFVFNWIEGLLLLGGPLLIIITL